MKKFLIAAAFVTFCSVGSVFAQSAVRVEKAEAISTDQQVQKETAKPAAKAGSCCSSKKGADAKSCSSAKDEKAAGKSSCCQKGGHNHGHADAKTEGTSEEKKN